MENRFFFDTGVTLRDICCGNAERALREIENVFGVHLIARDNWIQISGPDVSSGRTERMLSRLSDFYKLKQRRIDSRDFDFICRIYAEGREDEFQSLWDERITVSPRKPEIIPRSGNQREYIRLMRKCEVVFGIGPAGTGKTYLAMAMAISEFLRGDIARIILTRPARESGENLGYLPGSLEDKIMPYLRPLYDALYDMLGQDEVADLMSKGIIEVAPLAFMRGRTLNNAFVVLDEAQNTTSEQMLMFLTRMGFHSKIVVTGDPSQSDLQSREKSGLLQAERCLDGIGGIGFIRFSTADVVRHRLLEKIILAYNGDAEQ